MRANRGRSRAATRRIAGALSAVAVLVGMLASVPAGADTKSDLARAKARLSQLERQIDAERVQLADLQRQQDAQRARLAELQGELNDLATKIDQAKNAYDATVAQVDLTEHRLREARQQYERLRARLNQRARVAYEMGPESTLGVILGASSLSDLSDRIQFVNRLSFYDANLANDVQNRANTLALQRSHLEAIRQAQIAALADLQSQQRALDAKFGEANTIYDDLAAKAAEASRLTQSLSSSQAEVGALVTKLARKLKAEQLAAAREAQRRAREAARRERQRQHDTGGGGGTGGPPPAGSPLSVCPVDEPHAYGDSFGAPRYAGGYHPHAGNDILAPEGTPIRAPFSGSAVNASNGLGGNAVIVYGSEGYVYNAHLVRYGTLGSVSAGTIIGYVGNTGDAQGGPTHDHFEWHPNVIPANPYRSAYGYTIIGSAIDPYPYLNMVC